MINYITAKCEFCGHVGSYNFDLAELQKRLKINPEMETVFDCYGCSKRNYNDDFLERPQLIMWIHTGPTNPPLQTSS